jgi:hypothetical protein
MNCFIKIDRNEMTNHLDDECVESEIKCSFCESSSIKRKDMNEHL